MFLARVAGGTLAGSRLAILTDQAQGCTFTVCQTRTGAIPDAGVPADADGTCASVPDLSAFCCSTTRTLLDP